MTTQLLLFHPDLGASHANRALADAAARLPGLTVHDMGAIYPDPRAIDTDREVERLLSADRLILQFPVQWYSTPPLLKAWQDAVLTRCYYLNPDEEGERMRDLPVMVSATAGNTPEAYGPGGTNLFPLEELLRPLQATANRCFWRWTKPFLMYRADKLDGPELATRAAAYAERITAWRSAEPPLARR